MQSLQRALLSILRDGFDQLWSCFPRCNRSYLPILQINYAGDPGIPWVYFLKLRKMKINMVAWPVLSFTPQSLSCFF